MALFHTNNSHGYSVKFSPINPTILAAATCENFGLSGCGTLYLLNINQRGCIEELSQRPWPSALFDLCWLGAAHPNLFVTASGDGSIQVWNLAVNSGPILNLTAHESEVSCLDCSNSECLSTSWDKTIKIWDGTTLTCLARFAGHSGPVYEARFSPQIPSILASVSGDRTLRIWSKETGKNVISIQAHDSEVLSCDWSKHNGNIIATSGSDSLIRCWDIRRYTQPLFQLKGGEQAIKQIKFSPNFPNILASCSFDFCTKIWDIRFGQPLECFRHHSAYVYGVDWNSLSVGELADCSWDGTIRVFKFQYLQHFKNKI